MKKIVSFAALAVFLIGGLNADEPGKRKGDAQRKENFRRPMSMPVYAVKPQERMNPPGMEMSAEQRAKFNAARKRRFEIMVLIGAYKIMPENERAALKAELLKRIEADFKATMAEQRERIARAEADLQKLRSEVAERESNSKVLVERELDRLLKIQYSRNRTKKQ